jgi:hypothetical protein
MNFGNGPMGGAAFVWDHAPNRFIHCPRRVPLRSRMLSCQPDGSCEARNVVSAAPNDSQEIFKTDPGHGREISVRRRCKVEGRARESHGQRGRDAQPKGHRGP